MRTVVLTAFGPPENLHVEEVADPTAGAGHALVEVEFAGITFVETQVRAGHAPNPTALPTLPTVLVNGFAGTVSRVGEGVGAEWGGRRVVRTTGGSGGYAEQVAVPVANLIEVPTEMDLADALALLAEGRTAVGLVDLVPMCEAERV
jgi:NADPH:quinone reductase